MDVRFGPKVGQIVTKWDKVCTYEDLDFSTFLLGEQRLLIKITDLSNLVII